MSARQVIVIELLKKIYPIGALYISAKEGSPGEIFKFGRWEERPHPQYYVYERVE